MTNHPLKWAREAKGLSQEQLARMVQVEVAVIQRLENGTAEAGPLLLGALEKALGFPRHLLVKLPKISREIVPGGERTIVGTLRGRRPTGLLADQFPNSPRRR
jgi:transcriptional regulator with XRE-family HTH domain